MSGRSLCIHCPGMSKTRLSSNDGFFGIGPFSRKIHSNSWGRNVKQNNYSLRENFSKFQWRIDLEFKICTVFPIETEGIFQSARQPC